MIAFHRLTRKCPVYMAFITFFVIFFNEFFIYTFYRLKWNQIPCYGANCTRILFVADPQILGKSMDKTLVNRLAIFDSDRYLRNSFTRAIAHVKPDVICFMGDLMDEGSIATNEEHNEYLHRFKEIFYTDSKVAIMQIPGDNDIGGEDDDRISDRKVNRFREAFNERSYLEVKDLYRLLNVNLLTHKFPELNERPSDDKTEWREFTNIVLTHISLLSYPGLSLNKVIEKFKPSVIFSAHTHVSRLITYPPLRIEGLEENRVRSFNLPTSKMVSNQKKFTEIMLPTCSYRMGVDKIGFGMAVLENDKLQYTVLWLPKRFIYLWLYVGYISIFVTLLFIWMILKRKSICARRVVYRQRLLIADNVF